jgi:hypothetical protein
MNREPDIELRRAVSAVLCLRICTSLECKASRAILVRASQPPLLHYSTPDGPCINTNSHLSYTPAPTIFLNVGSRPLQRCTYSSIKKGHPSENSASQCSEGGLAPRLMRGCRCNAGVAGSCEPPGEAFQLDARQSQPALAQTVLQHVFAYPNQIVPSFP